jgi:hypothetical protein
LGYEELQKQIQGGLVYQKGGQPHYGEGKAAIKTMSRPQKMRASS